MKILIKKKKSNLKFQLITVALVSLAVISVELLRSDRKVQLISNPKYKSVRYVGIHVPVEKKLTLEADCSTSPRLKGSFGSMKNQFKN